MLKTRLTVASMLLFGTTGCIQKTERPPGEQTASPGATAEEATPRETLNKTTQVVLDLNAAIADGAVLAETNIAATDPLTQSAAAYRTTAGKLSGMKVHQAIQLRNAQSIKDPKPLSHADLMKDIIRPGEPDGIALPMLPYYQEYSWDVAQQALIVVDFPARQAERQKQIDSN